MGCGRTRRLKMSTQRVSDCRQLRRHQHEKKNRNNHNPITRAQVHLGKMPKLRPKRNSHFPQKHLSVLTRREPMQILAHRGASADKPENTLSAFYEAIAQGADGVEFDVMRCRSGEVVVFHDDSLTRLAEVDWLVTETDYSKLATARILGSERIPLFEEVLDILPHHFIVNVELKCHEFQDKGLSMAVGQILTRRKRIEKTVVSSFNAVNLLRLKRAFPTLPRGYLFEPGRYFFLQGKCLGPWIANTSIHPHSDDCTPERVRAWHQRGLKVAVWTVDDASRARALRQMEIDMLITNRPRELKTALGVAA